jgi:cysteinyl-tRNA synthetase
VYIREKRPDGTLPNRLLLRNIASYITNILRIFGAISGDDSIGFPLAGAGSINVNILNMNSKLLRLILFFFLWP